MHHLLFWFCSLVWGSSFILMKRAAVLFSPISVGGWRAFAGGATLALLWWWVGRKQWRFRASILPKIAVVALMGNIFPHSVQPLLVVRYGSGFIGMTVAFVPLLTILVSIPMLGIFPNRRQVFGVIGGLVCLGMMMADGLDRDMTLGMILLALLVPLCYAIANTFVRQQLQDEPSLPVTTLTLLMTSSVLLPLTFFEQQLGMPGPPVDAATATSSQWQTAIGALFILGAAGTGLATFAFLKLIVIKGPLFAGMVTYVIPVGAVLLGAIDGEEITLMQMLALAGVLLMVALVQLPARRRREATNSEDLEAAANRLPR